MRELREEMGELEDEKNALRRELWDWKARALLDDAEEINGIRVISYVEDAPPMKDAQAFVVHLVDRNPGTIVLVAGGENYVVFARNREVKGPSMKDLLEKVLSEVGGGGGGGSEILARGGGFKAPPEEVLKVARRPWGGITLDDPP